MHKLFFCAFMLVMFISSCAPAAQQEEEAPRVIDTPSLPTEEPDKDDSAPTESPYAALEPTDFGCRTDENILYLDDFELGGDRSWLSADWVVETADGVSALNAANGGFSELAPDNETEAYRLAVRLRIDSGGVLLYYLTSRGSGGYAVQVGPEGSLSLQDFSTDPPEHGAGSRHGLEIGQWHDLSIVLREDSVAVDIDGSPALTYLDADPPERGVIALELLDPSAMVSVDFIALCTIGEQVVVEAPTSDFVAWEKATSPPAHSFSLLTVASSAPQNVYATSEDANLWGSTDGGITWEQLGERQFGAHIFSNVAVHPQDDKTVFTSNGVLHVSRDGGKSWEGLFGSGDSLGVVSVAFSPGNPDVMYAGDDKSRLYSSQDGGRNWSEVGVIPSGLLTELWIDPEDSKRLMAGSQDGLYLSDDGGRSFDIVLSGPVRERSLTGDPTHAEVAYAIQQGRLVQTTDRGRTWESLSVSNPTSVAAIGEDLYIGTNSGVMHSANGGLSWETTGYDIQEFGVPTALVVNPGDPEQVYSASEETLAYSMDGGRTWTTGDGLIVDDFFTLALHPADPERIFAGLFWTLGMFRSDDGSRTWDWLHSYIHTPPGHEHYPMAISLDPRDEDLAFVTGAYGFRVTRDGGHTWAPLLDESHMHGLARAPSDADVMYVGNGLGDVDKEVPGTRLFKSSDGGKTWQDAQGWPKELEANIYAITISPTDPNLVYVGTNQHDWSQVHGGNHADGLGLYRSRDGGQSFEQINNGLTETNVFSIAIDPFYPNVIYVGTASEGHGSLFRSDDSGDSWVDFSSGLPDMDVHSIALWPTNSEVVLVGLAANIQAGNGIPPQGAGVWISEDGGASWADASSGLVDRGQVVFDLVFTPDGTTLYAGTDDGIYRGSIRSE